MTEKTLEGFNDVFADIVNVLLFKNKRLIKEDELTAESPRSIYKADGKLHEQERDVAKYWRRGTIRIALLGFENQTEPDADMPLRVLSYDGSAYRAQLTANKSDEGTPDRYPVVTLVLYFGYKNHWNKPTNLLERLKFPEELKPFLNDYRINLFEIAWLTDEQVSMFQSDFHLVADYFVQMRKNKGYTPPKESIRHVHEFLQLMSVMTGDNRYEETYNEQMEGGSTNMCEVLDLVENRGIEKGRMKTAAKTLKRYVSRSLPITSQVIDDIANDNDTTAEKIRELAHELGIPLS